MKGERLLRDCRSTWSCSVLLFLRNITLRMLPLSIKAVAYLMRILGRLLLQAALSQAQLSTWELRAVGRNTKQVKHTTGEHRTYQEERCDNQTGEQVTSNNIFHGSSRRKMICPRQILQ